MGNSEIIKTIAPLTAPFTAAVVETWLKPVLLKLRESSRIDRDLIENGFTSKFSEYVNRTFERLSYMNVLVFPNQRKLLDDLYIPTRIEVQERRGESVILDSFPEGFAVGGHRALIVDSAGMGKSTSLKFLFLSAVRQNLGVPFFLELRKLSRELTLVDAIIRELTPITGEISPQFVRQLIAGGHFIFLLDGYDEIPLAEREYVTVELHDFISKASQNAYVITSRPEAALAGFNDFSGYHILPLERSEAFSLLTRYDGGGELSTRLISTLERNELPVLSEFLGNPLLVSLLYKSYEYKPIVPFKKPIFYRQVYDALFESHDLSKGGAYQREKRSGLDIEDFHRVLRALGFITAKLGKVAYSRDELVRYIGQALALAENPTSKSSFLLQDLVTSVPLFFQEGHEYRWSHKSIQEYFASCFICFDGKELQGEILRQLATKSQQYINILDLCYDLDYPSFQREILADLVRAFVAHCDATYQAEYAGVKPETIDVRRTRTFLHIFVLGPLTEKDANWFLMGDGAPDHWGIVIPPEYQSLWMHRDNDPQVRGAIVAYDVPQRKQLLHLLVLKHDPLVIKSSYDRMSIHVNNSAFESLVPTLGQMDSIRLLNDSPLEPYNSGKLFAVTNDALLGYAGVYLNLAECRSLSKKLNAFTGEARRHSILEGF